MSSIFVRFCYRYLIKFHFFFFFFFFLSLQSECVDPVRSGSHSPPRQALGAVVPLGAAIKIAALLAEAQEKRAKTM
jgi:hypothetical protein